MSQIYFQAKVNLTTATPVNVEMTSWECTLTFTDLEGVFTGLNIQTGDVVVFDTGMFETGTFSFYSVDAIITPDSFQPIVTLTYMSVNDNPGGSPDLGGYIVGSDGVISRPTPNYGLLPVVSRDIQLISDKFTEYVQNYNFGRIVDITMSDFSVAKYTKINRDSITLFKGMPVYISDSDFNNIYRATANATHEQTRVAGLVADESILIDNPGRIVCTGIIQLSTAQWDALTGDTGGLDGGRDYFLRGDGGMGLTLTPPTTGFIVKVGKALSPTAFDVNIEPPIEL